MGMSTMKIQATSEMPLKQGEHCQSSVFQNLRFVAKSQEVFQLGTSSKDSFKFHKIFKNKEKLVWFSTVAQAVFEFF